MNLIKRMEIIKNQMTEYCLELEALEGELSFIYNEVKELSPEKNFTENDLVNLDACILRYIRMVDFFTDKILPTYFLLFMEMPKSIESKGALLTKLAITENPKEFTEHYQLKERLIKPQSDYKYKQYYAEAIKAVPNLLNLTRTIETDFTERFMNK